MQSICSIGIQHTKWCIQSLFVAVHNAGERRLYRDETKRFYSLCVLLCKISAATLESVARFLNSAMICDLFWSGTQRRKWRIQSIWKKISSLVVVAHNAHSGERRTIIARRLVFAFKMPPPNTKGVGLAKVWTREKQRETKNRQREQRQHSSKTFTIDSDGDEDDENDYEDDFDDSDDDDGRGNDDDNDNNQKRKKSSKRALNNVARAYQHEKKKKKFYYYAQQRTNFQSAGSFWSR